MSACEWFALCDHPATLLVPHPILGQVPTCQRCAERHNLTGRSGVVALGSAICDGCNVRGVWEHRCHGEPCGCADCAEERRLFGPQHAGSGRES